MKTLQFLLSALIVLCLNSCTNDLSETTALEANGALEVQGKVVPFTSPEFVKENPEMAKELLQLQSAVANVNTLKQSIKRGWDYALTPWFANMGYHYGNMGLIDDVFEIEKPEAILIACGPNGKLVAVGVEYLVAGDPSVPPTGFTGDADVWAWNTTVNLWTLHVWNKRYNPDGIFNPTNSMVGETQSCSGD